MPQTRKELMFQHDPALLPREEGGGSVIESKGCL